MASLLDETIGGEPPVGPRAVRDRDYHAFVEAVGERVALLGGDEGRMEVWMWPMLVLHDLEVLAGPAGGGLLPLGERVVTAVPEGVQLAWEHRGARIALTVVAARRERGLVLLAEVDAEGAALDLGLRFRPAMRPMWPAGLGGPLAGRDGETGAVVLSEELGRFAALVGCEEAVGPESPCLERLDFEAQAELRVRVERSRDASDPIVFAIGGAIRETGRPAADFARARETVGSAREVLRSMWSGWRELVAAERARWRAFLANTTALETDDAPLDAAHVWSRIAVERAWVDVDGVGRVVVGGYGPGYGGARPGAAWLHQGDALEACRAYASLGRAEACRDILRFAAGTQREDGKLAHEVSLGAALCDGYGAYPHAYAGVHPTPEFVVALAEHVAWSGDLDLARELWPSVRAALAWCRTVCGEDGAIRAPGVPFESGTAASALDSEALLRETLRSARRAAVQLAERIGEAVDVDPASLESTARSDAELLDALRPERAADWGGRLPLAAPDRKGRTRAAGGRVFPRLTGPLATALYRRGLDDAGWQVVRSQAALVGLDGPGAMPDLLAGDRARLLPTSVPHHVASHASLVRVVAEGLFGIVPGTRRSAPRVPLELERMALRGVPAPGGERFDVDAAPAPGRPRIALPWQVDVYAPSANVRLVASTSEPGATRWTLAGPAATTVRMRFEAPAGARVEGARVEGRQLAVAFPTAAPGTPSGAVGFAETTVRIVTESPA